MWIYMEAEARIELALGSYKIPRSTVELFHQKNQFKPVEVRLLSRACVPRLSMMSNRGYYPPLALPGADGLLDRPLL